MMIEHKNLINFTYHYDLKKSISALTCNYVFDVSVLEIFSTLLSGSKLLIPANNTILSPFDYADFLYKNKVSHCYIHPMHLGEIASTLDKFQKTFLTAYINRSGANR